MKMAAMKLGNTPRTAAWIETELGQRAGRTGPKTPGPVRTGRPAQALSGPVRAHLPPRVSSWHFGLFALDL
jgi:hypothetical protein